MLSTSGKLPLRAHKKIWMVFLIMLTVFVCLTIANEVLDVPHYAFGDEPTSYPQRKGEITLELLIYSVVIFSSYYYFRKKIEKEIKIYLKVLYRFVQNAKKLDTILIGKYWKNTLARTLSLSLATQYALIA